LNPNGRLLGVVGDSNSNYILSADTGELVAELDGYMDHSFACCWSPNGQFLAMGSQDLFARIYDVRNLSKEIWRIPSMMAPIRSLQFDPTGRYLAAAEGADFLHFIDPTNQANTQIFSFFGEISGFSYSSNHNLYLGIADKWYGGILEMSPLEVMEDVEIHY
jgi:WD40 repeat protein